MRALVLRFASALLVVGALALAPLQAQDAAQTSQQPATPMPEAGQAQGGPEHADKPQEATQKPQPDTAQKPPAVASGLPRADSTTAHALELPGRTLHFHATVGTIPLTGAEGQVHARIVYTAYTLDDADGRSRPVAFVVNGGPGASSAWLQLGALGPWRLPIDGDNARPSAAGIVTPNSETWLDFADLVFIDPVGTGYSTVVTHQAGKGGKDEQRGPSRDELQKRYWSIDGDIDSLADFISKWLAKADRHISPKLLVGESYGGFRVPKIAKELQTEYGIGTNLLVLLSPVLDYGFLRGGRHLPLNTVALLPSLAASALESKGTIPSPSGMREAEEYARGQYLTDLMRGPRDKAAVDRIVARVAALTDLSPDTVRRFGGRLDSFGYRREANEGTGRIASAYDASITGLNPNPNAPFAHAQDPFMTAVRAPLTSAMLNLYASKLDWRTDARYLLLNGEVSGHWQYGNSPSPPEVVSDLKSTLALDPRMRVLVAHGYTDLVTPYFASTLVLDQLPEYGDAKRLVQTTYPGGHMFYSRNGSRAAFREDVLIMLAASLNGEAQTR